MERLGKIALFLEENFEKGIASFFMSVITVVLIINIFFRYVLATPLTWPLEIVSFLFPWFVYLGACYGVREGAHIRLTHHILLLPKSFQLAIRITADLCWLFYSIVMTVQGIRLVHSMFEFQYMSQVIPISRAYIYTIIPFAFFLMSLRVVSHIVRLVLGKMEPYTFRQQKQLLD